MELLASGDTRTSFLPDVYFARMDVEPSGLRAFMNWYAEKHAPDTISVGFYSAQGYQCRIGKPFVCNVYEIESSEIFYTSDYELMRTPEQDPQRPGILETVSNRSNTVYSQIAALTRSQPTQPWSAGAREGAIDGPAITTVRFDVAEEDESSLIEWAETNHFHWLGGLKGFQGARICRQAGRLHPANPSTEPRWVLMAEWDGQSDAEAAGSAAETISSIEEAPISVQHPEYNLAVRVLSLRN